LVISGYNQIYRLRNYFTLIINLKLKKNGSIYRLYPY
jgi:hypothetical protein